MFHLLFENVLLVALVVFGLFAIGFSVYASFDPNRKYLYYMLELEEKDRRRKAAENADPIAYGMLAVLDARRGAR